MRALLREIPYGETTTSARSSPSSATRAASAPSGLANGRNPHPIVVPSTG